jgi:integrase
MRSFYLHKRQGIYYAELVDPKTGRRLTAKSTRATCRDDAVIVVYDWLKNGVPAKTKKARLVDELFTFSSVLETLRSIPLEPQDAGKITDLLKQRGLIVSAVVSGGPGAELFGDYIRRFWTYEKSPYVLDKHAHDQRMGKTHCFESLGRAEKYWIPYFTGKHLAEISRADIKAFSLHLATPELDLKPITRNRILTVGTTALRWAYENDLLAEDITAGVSTFSGKPEIRGILTPEEASAIFRIEWIDERVRLANLLAMTTGLRAGEIIALRREDVAEAWLCVRHSYSRRDLLKTTKTGAERRVPIISSIRTELLALAERSPWGSDGYIFYGEEKADIPMSQNLLLYGLQEALLRLSLGDMYSTATDEERDKASAAWKARNVVFHSWRHFYASRMSDHLDARKIMLATGHRTEAVFDAYAGHALESDLAEVGAVSAEVFGNILSFQKATA